MRRNLRYYIFLISSTSVLMKEPELPLCPANFQFLPQNLPMHCRLPVSAHQPPPFPSPFFPGSLPVPQNSQVVPVPPVPGFPPGIPIGAPGYAPGLPPGAFPPGYAMQPGMPMPMPGAPPSAKLPVIVMPFYSPDPSFKGPNLRPGSRDRDESRKRRRRIKQRERDSDTDSDTDTEDSSESDYGFWKSRRTMKKEGKPRRRRKHSRKRKELLTPILQYVTKDGYVIYEKKISDGEAKGWLGKGQNMKQKDNATPEPAPKENSEEVRVIEEEEDVVITQTTHEPPKVMQVKIQNHSEKRSGRRHPRRKPNYLIEKPMDGKE